MVGLVIVQTPKAVVQVSYRLHYGAVPSESASIALKSWETVGSRSPDFFQAAVSPDDLDELPRTLFQVHDSRHLDAPDL